MWVNFTLGNGDIMMQCMFEQGFITKGIVLNLAVNEHKEKITFCHTLSTAIVF